MSEIENLAEGQAFMDAADDILGLNHPFRDAEIARLRRAWIAGRDWQRSQTARLAPDDEAVQAAAGRLAQATDLADDSLTDFEADVKTVARAVLARDGERERMRAALQMAVDRATMPSFIFERTYGKVIHDENDLAFGYRLRAALAGPPASGEGTGSSESSFWCRFGCLDGAACPHCNCDACLLSWGVKRPDR